LASTLTQINKLYHPQSVVLFKTFHKRRHIIKFSTSMSILSPSAPPFFPSDNFCGSFKALYYNSRPVGVVGCSEHEVLQNIPDHAIDDAFPKSAIDAAEMDAMDDFVNTMVDLSFLEDKEEKARSLTSHVGKRWESRREDGLRGKPYHASGLINSNLHGSTSGDRNEQMLTKQQLNLYSNTYYDKDIGRYPYPKINQANTKVFHGKSRNIQQPRKQN